MRPSTIVLMPLFASLPLVANAQTSPVNWGQYVYAGVISAEPVSVGQTPQVRLPSLIDHSLPASLMPKVLVDENGPFFAEVTAIVVIGGDDTQAECRTVKATIRRGEFGQQKPEALLVLDVCGLLRQSAHFRHAIGADGLPMASTAKLSVLFGRFDPAHVGPPPIAPIAKTSGHVLDAAGHWIDGRWWVQKITIPAPDWSAALPDHRDLPKEARVGVQLKLVAKGGIGSVGSCKVELTSGDARLDAATCTALSTAGYSEYQGKAYNGIEAYPILVQWHGEAADMVSPALPTVPHMPKDVPLAPADLPAAEPAKPGAIPIRIMLDSDGKVSGCTVTQSSGSDLWDAASCRIALARAHFTAARDAFDRPARGLYEAIADWTAMTIHPAQE